MQLREVLTQKDAADFIRVNVELNRNNPAYIRPLDKDVNDVFDPKKNKAFRHGTAKRWLLLDQDGKTIGRIAAYVNKKYKNMGDEGPVGGVGFFDCINDQQGADMLFDVAKHWLLQQGMEFMDGPINFGERDRWWGLVVKGHEIPPLYCMNFNPPYYVELFEKYGFKNFFNQICFGLTTADRIQDKFYERHAIISANPDFCARHIRKNELAKFAKDFTTVYNRAWAGHGGLKTMDEKVVLKMFNSMKPVMDEQISWFVYYKDEPVAIWLNIPDLNQWFKHLNGKFGLFHKLKFLWVKRTKVCNKFVGIIFGVVPEWQGKGVDSYMIVEGAKVIQPKPLYEKYEMQWIGEFNPKMINVAESLGTFRSRVLTTYRYAFDPAKPAKPHPVFR